MAERWVVAQIAPVRFRPATHKSICLGRQGEIAIKIPGVDLLLYQRAATAKESIAPLTLTSEMTPEERKSVFLSAIAELKKKS